MMRWNVFLLRRRRWPTQWWWRWFYCPDVGDRGCSNHGCPSFLCSSINLWARWFPWPCDRARDRRFPCCSHAMGASREAWQSGWHRRVIQSQSNCPSGRQKKSSRTTPHNSSKHWGFHGEGPEARATSSFEWAAAADEGFWSGDGSWSWDQSCRFSSGSRAMWTMCLLWDWQSGGEGQT